MEIIKIVKNNNYCVMSTYHLRDDKLSLKAVGLLSKILSLRTDWNLSIKGLSKICKESEDSISKIINELIDNGYIIRNCKRENGKFIYEYIIYEIPVNDFPDSTAPQKPGTVKPATETAVLEEGLNKYDNKKEYSNDILSNNNISIVDKIVDKNSLFEYFKIFDFENYKKYEDLYYKIYSETNHNTLVLFCYVFKKIELDNINVLYKYNYVESAIYQNIKKLELDIEPIDWDWLSENLSEEVVI